MNKELQQLKDIHLPQAVSMWPTAPGWLALYAVLTGLTAYLVYRWYLWKRRQNTVKFAMARLKNLEKLIAHNPKNINIAAEISTLLRRTALYYFPRDEIAGLTGEDWLNFLNQSSGTTQFTSDSGRLLIDAPYRKNTEFDLLPLITLTHSWLMAVAKKQPWSAEK